MGAVAGGKHVLGVAVGDPADVTSFIVARLGIAAADARRLIERGAVEVNRRRADMKTPLAPGARVVVREPPAAASSPLSGPAPAPPTTAATPASPATPVGTPAATTTASATKAAARIPGAPDIVYEDADLIVVDKPVGMLSQPSPSEHGSSVAAFLARRDPGVHLLHRLDRDASGLLVASRRPEAHAALQHALAGGRVDREYLAVAAGRITGARDIRLRIARDGRDTRLRQALPEAAPGGQAAHTHVTPLAVLAAGTLDGVGEATLLRVVLDTGRTHQIRVHLAALGHPLVGDRLYGGPPFARLLLHAETLRLPHPYTGRPLTLTAPLPAEFAALQQAPHDAV